MDAWPDEIKHDDFGHDSLQFFIDALGTKFNCDGKEIFELVRKTHCGASKSVLEFPILNRSTEPSYFSNLIG